MDTDAFRLNLDRMSAAHHVGELRFFARVAGNHPHVVSAEIRPAAVPMDILPAECELIASCQVSGFAQVVAEASDITVQVDSYGDFSYVRVAARSYASAFAVMEAIKRDAVKADATPSTYITFWNHKEVRGGESSTRASTVRRWSEIRKNYPRSVRSRLEHLTGCKEPTEGAGRLILFHGEPGTGKTTAIQALMHEWSPWCSAHLVSDPDRLFADSQYLSRVLESQEGRFAPGIDRPADPPKWKLIVAEDADAYLRSTARRDAGAALGQLLNATDGLLGQSTRCIVLLTTNEELTRLHPALIRPGRCLARTEFVRFPREEADEWLGRPSSGPVGGATLAELFETQRTGGTLPGEVLRTGSYL